VWPMPSSTKFLSFVCFVFSTRKLLLELTYRVIGSYFAGILYRSL
jgi:hypothetical protein